MRNYFTYKVYKRDEVLFEGHLSKVLDFLHISDSTLRTHIRDNKPIGEERYIVKCEQYVSKLNKVLETDEEIDYMVKSLIQFGNTILCNQTKKQNKNPNEYIDRLLKDERIKERGIKRITYREAYTLGDKMVANRNRARKSLYYVLECV